MQPDHPAFPARWLYGLYVLSPVTGLFCHRRSRRSSRQRTWPQRREARTIRLHRPQQRRSSARASRARRRRGHRIPAPRFVTMRIRPSRARRDARIKPLIWGAVKPLYENQNMHPAANWRDGQSVHGAHAGIARRARSAGGRAICPSLARHDGGWQTRLETQRLCSDGRHGAYRPSRRT